VANSPNFKVYSPAGEYVAACKHAEDAACLAALYGDDATIRYRHRHVVWEEGNENQPADESYDYVAKVILDRVRAIFQIRTREEE